MEEKETYSKEEVEQLKAELQAKHNSEMANMRKKNESEVAKAKMSAEELAKAQAEEEKLALETELNDLRNYKKQNVLTERLAKENLPSFFKNDTRLLNAKDDKELDNAIKSIKNEYASSQPKGATHSTVVQSGRTDQTNEQSAKSEVHQSMNDTIRQAFGYK